MSEHTQDPQGEEPATDAPVNPSGEQPVDTAAFHAEIENSNPAELAKALGFDYEEAPIEDGDEPADPAPKTEPTEEESEEDPAAGEGEEDEPDAKPVARRRLSVTGLPDEDKELNAKAIALVREGKAANLFEAMKSLVGEGTPAADADEDAADDGDEPADEPDTPPTLDELKQQIADLREERRKAKSDFDTDEEIRLTEAIEDLQIAVVRAEQAEATKKVEVSNYQAEYADAVEAMEAKYADVLDDETNPFADLLEERIEAAKARRDPMLADPKFVLTLADDLAAKLKVGTAKKERAPVSDPPRESRVGAAVAPAGKAKPQLTKRQAEEFIDKLPAEKLAEALWPA